jgi:hypothetical protein
MRLERCAACPAKLVTLNATLGPRNRMRSRTRLPHAGGYAATLIQTATLIHVRHSAPFHLTSIDVSLERALLATDGADSLLATSAANSFFTASSARDGAAMTR